jgi:hypothetical protein
MSIRHYSTKDRPISCAITIKITHSLIASPSSSCRSSASVPPLPSINILSKRVSQKSHSPRQPTASVSNQGLEPTRYTAWLRASVCAVHAVMLGGESPPSRCTWSRRTREAPGRHREVGSEGRVERTCGARDTNRIRGVVQPGRAGTPQHSPPSTTGLCLINPASMHGRYDS